MGSFPSTPSVRAKSLPVPIGSTASAGPIFSAGDFAAAAAAVIAAGTTACVDADAPASASELAPVPMLLQGPSSTHCMMPLTTCIYDWQERWERDIFNLQALACACCTVAEIKE